MPAPVRMSGVGVGREQYTAHLREKKRRFDALCDAAKAYLAAELDVTSRGEPAFALFIHQFCTWKPEPDDEDSQGRPAAASGIIDLDADEDKGAES